MGGFADEFNEFRQDWVPSVGPSCHVGDLLAELDAKDREAFEALLDDTRIYATSIALRLAHIAEHLDDPKMGPLFRQVKAGSIQRHRRRECRCDRQK